jgi:MFS family permease
LTVGTLAWTAGAWIQAREAKRRSHRALVVTGQALMAIGIAGTGAVLAPGVPSAIVWVTWAIASLGMGMAYSTNALVILQSAPEGGEGKASASLQLAITLGIAIGTGIGGAIVAFTTDGSEAPTLGIALVNAMTVAVLLVGLLAARGLPRGSHDTGAQ